MNIAKYKDNQALDDNNILTSKIKYVHFFNETVESFNNFGRANERSENNNLSMNLDVIA